MMNEYEKTLERIHSMERFGSILGLERMGNLLGRLGDPHKGLPVIHVAGTNGKGSVCRYLSCALRENGLKVGLYTSPYLEDFTERIEYDGQPISHEELVATAAEVFRAVEAIKAAGEDIPTEFEVVTAIGFLYYSRKPLDCLVLEVGMGGRGDATNVIEQSLASVVTSIDFDHMAQLGNTLGAIAGEKAGIFKEGCPVVYTVHSDEAEASIVKKAEEKGCPLISAGIAEAQDLKLFPYGAEFTAMLPEKDGGIYKVPGTVSISMGGVHQVENALTALTCLHLLRETLGLDEEACLRGLKKAVQHGRFEVLEREPWLIIDGAHNPAGIESLVDAVKRFFPGEKILLLLGVLADKERDPMLEKLLTLPMDVICTEPLNNRKLAAEQLAEQMKAGLPEESRCMACSDWEEACDLFAAHRKEYKLALAAGSLYLIGAVRTYFRKKKENGEQ